MSFPSPPSATGRLGPIATFSVTDFARVARQLRP